MSTTDSDTVTSDSDINVDSPDCVYISGNVRRQLVSSSEECDHIYEHDLQDNLILQDTVVSPDDINKKYWQKILCTCVCTCLANGGGLGSYGYSQGYTQHGYEMASPRSMVSGGRSRGGGSPGRVAYNPYAPVNSQGYEDGRSRKSISRAGSHGYDVLPRRNFTGDEGCHRRDHSHGNNEGRGNHSHSHGYDRVPSRGISQVFDDNPTPRRVNSQAFEGTPRGVNNIHPLLKKSKSIRSRRVDSPSCDSKSRDDLPRLVDAQGYEVHRPRRSKSSRSRGGGPQGFESASRGGIGFENSPTGGVSHDFDGSPRNVDTEGYDAPCLQRSRSGRSNRSVRSGKSGQSRGCSHRLERRPRSCSHHSHGNEKPSRRADANNMVVLSRGVHLEDESDGGRSMSSEHEQSTPAMYMGNMKSSKVKEWGFPVNDNIYRDVKMFIGGASMYFPIFMLGIPKFKRCGAVNKRWGNTNLRVHAILHETLPPAECYNDGTSCMCKVKPGEATCCSVTWPPESPSFIGESPDVDHLRVLNGEHVIWETFVDIRMVFLGEDPINGDEIFSACMPRVPSYEAYVRSVRELKKRVSSYERKQYIKANLEKNIQEVDLNTCTYTVRCVLYESQLQERPVRILGDGLTKVPCNKIILEDGSKFDGETCMSGWKTIPKNLDIDFKRGSHYELQWPANRQATDRPTIYSLRDGCLQEGTDLFDLGLLIKFVTRIYSEWWKRIPFMHYFDEIDGVWRQKDFSVNRSSRRTTEYFVQIPNAKRVIFIIGDRKDETKWIKAEGEYDFMLPFSGCYEVFESGKTIQISKSVPLLNKKSTNVDDVVMRQDSVGNSSELSPSEFPSHGTPGFREGKLEFEQPQDDMVDNLRSEVVQNKRADVIQGDMWRGMGRGMLLTPVNAPEESQTSPTPERDNGDIPHGKRVEFFQLADV